MNNHECIPNEDIGQTLTRICQRKQKQLVQIKNVIFLFTLILKNETFRQYDDN